jgi:signal transduction histidine kinase
VLALVVGLAFALVVAAVDDLRDASRDADRSEQAIAASHELERLVVDLETGERGYVITGDERFLEPFRVARARIPALVRELEAPSLSPAQRALARRIAGDVDDYRAAWLDRVIARARRDRDGAAALVATGEGKRRLDAIRSRFADFRGREEAFAAGRVERADETGRRAVLVAVVGLVGSALVVALYAAYLRRQVARPVEEVTAGLGRLARGDLAARVEAGGAGEVAELRTGFNSTAEALERHRDEVVRRSAELEAVLDATTDGIGMTDLDGNLVFSNRAMAEIWDELEMPHGGAILDRIALLAQRTPDPQRSLELFAERADDPDYELAEEFDVPAAGRSFLGYTAPVRTPDRGTIGRLWVLRETTAQREADRLKDEVVATVSHELRTPLTVMIGYLELVLDGEAGEVNAKQREFLEIVERNAERLTMLVRDLLFVAQVNANALRVDRRPVDLAELASAAVASARAAAGAKDLTLTLEAEPVHTNADPARIGQLLDNLVSNAIKFTPEGGTVTVRVDHAGEAALLEVADSGIGIPEGEQEQLFQRFFRTSSARSREIPGTGLGLAICRAIAEAHGGTIEAESTEGVGTTFRVTLPPAAVREAA